MKHTTLPWKIFPALDGRYHIMADYQTIITIWDFPEAKANAEFIVRACNCHEELVDLCQYIDYAVGGDEGEVYVNDEILEIHVTGKFIKELKQALANATK